MTGISESDLIHQLLSRNERAYSYLYDAYSSALFGSIKRMVRCSLTAEEILQNVFLKVWLHIDRYAGAKGSLFTWMSSIARNEAIDYLRSKQVKHKCHTSPLTEAETKSAALIERRLERLDLLKSLSSLPHKERVIIELFSIGFTCKEIGHLLRLPEGTVKTKMRRIYQKLRAILV